LKPYHTVQQSEASFSKVVHLEYLIITTVVIRRSFDKILVKFFVTNFQKFKIMMIQNVTVMSRSRVQQIIL